MLKGERNTHRRLRSADMCGTHSVFSFGRRWQPPVAVMRARRDTSLGADVIWHHLHFVPGQLQQMKTCGRCKERVRNADKLRMEDGVYVLLHN